MGEKERGLMACRFACLEMMPEFPAIGVKQHGRLARRRPWAAGVIAGGKL
jgi:hypothetical protein